MFAQNHSLLLSSLFPTERLQEEVQPTYCSASLMHFPSHQQFMSCRLPDLEVTPLYLITLDGFLWLLKIREPWNF